MTQDKKSTSGKVKFLFALIASALIAVIAHYAYQKLYPLSFEVTVSPSREFFIQSNGWIGIQDSDEHFILFVSWKRRGLLGFGKPVHIAKMNMQGPLVEHENRYEIDRIFYRKGEGKPFLWGSGPELGEIVLEWSPTEERLVGSIESDRFPFRIPNSFPIY